MTALSGVTNRVNNHNGFHNKPSAPIKDVEMEDVEKTAGKASQNGLHRGASKAEATAKRKCVEWDDMHENEDFRTISIRFPMKGLKGQTVKFSTAEAATLKFGGEKLRPYVSIDRRGHYVKGDFESYMSYEFIDGKLFRPDNVRANYLIMEDLKARTAYYTKEIADSKKRMGEKLV